MDDDDEGDEYEGDEYEGDAFENKTRITQPSAIATK